MLALLKSVATLGAAHHVRRSGDALAEDITVPDVLLVPGPLPDVIQLVFD